MAYRISGSGYCEICESIFEFSGKPQSVQAMNEIVVRTHQSAKPGCGSEFIGILRLNDIPDVMSGEAFLSTLPKTKEEAKKLRNRVDSLLGEILKGK